MTINNIRNLYHAETGIELIFCKNSTISYPLHNHVSVLTISIILDGSVILTTNHGTRVYTQNETFAIFPYTTHQFQIQNRIRKAQRLIHIAETITEVALATGFCDQSHFIKQFEKYVGLPPLTHKSSSGTIY